MVGARGGKSWMGGVNEGRKEGGRKYMLNGSSQFWTGSGRGEESPHHGTPPRRSVANSQTYGD
jgi:hypothetical protein